MSGKRKRHSPEFKSKVALAATKGLKTSSELASEYQVHPTQITQWKRQLLSVIQDAFKNPSKGKQRTEDELTAPLYEQIGRLKVELDWLKKKLPKSMRGKCKMIEPHSENISISRQCELLGLSRSSYYYR